MLAAFYRISAARVSASAGQKHSSASSERVTLVAVLKTVVVEMNRSTWPIPAVPPAAGTSLAPSVYEAPGMQKVRHAIRPKGGRQTPPSGRAAVPSRDGAIPQDLRFGGKSPGMEAKPQHVERRCQHGWIDALEQLHRGVVGLQQRPTAVDGDGGKG